VAFLWNFGHTVATLLHETCKMPLGSGRHVIRCLLCGWVVSRQLPQCVEEFHSLHYAGCLSAFVMVCFFFRIFAPLSEFKHVIIFSPPHHLNQLLVAGYTWLELQWIDLIKLV